MPKVNVSVSHALETQEAKRRVADAIAQAHREHGDLASDISHGWNEETFTFSFTTYGFAVSGLLEIQSRQALFHCNLPLAAMMFKGKVEKSVREELSKLLS